MASIRLGTAVNIRLFQTLSAALNNNDSKFTHLIDGEALEDEFGRFRVWSGNLGALQKGHSALDYRLRDSPLLSSNALKLLKELEENITEAISIVTGVRLPYEQQPRSEEKDDEDVDDDFYSEDEDEGSETAAPKTELEQRFHEIVDIVDNLYKLSVRIRTPTIRSRSLKASSYQPKDPETGVDVLDQYAAFDLQYTRELVRYERMQHTQETKDDDPIIMRLSKAITLRRRQFMYWRRHRDKLGMSTVPEEGLVAKSAVERSEAHNRPNALEAQAGNPIITALKQAASEKTGKTMLSGTEATHHHQSLDEIVDSRSVTSYATTVRDLTGKGIDLPPPPKGADGDKDFECPYCFIICPARYGKGRAWKTHILQDLQPYLCTYPDCESSEQIFRSRREWSDHEASHRKAWRCPEHPNAVYRSKSGLEDHLRRKHPNSFPEAQLDSIINVGETSTVDTREKCPICFVEVDMEGGFSLQNHVANHLERLASFALPRNINDDQDGASSVASRGRSASSGSQDLSDVSFYSDASEGEEEELRRDMEKSEASLVFHEHDWDAGDIATPSGQGLLSAELLGHLPDSSQTSQKRLDFLFPSQDIAEDDFDEQMFDDETAEVVDHVDEMQTLRTYLLSLPGAKSVRFLRRFGWWRGYTKFGDQVSAQEAIGIFDNGRFPEVRVSQRVGNKATLKFSFPVLEKAEKGLLSPTRQSTTEEVDDASSASTESISHYEEKSKLELIPLLPASEIPTLRVLYRTRKLLQRDQSYAPNDAFNQIVSFCYYDITRLKVDAIVNSANRAMKITRLNDSLNYHIHKQAGTGLQRECKAAGSIKVGQTRLTSGCDLPANYVIHAARPHYSGSKGMGKFNVLTECYRNSLKTAMNHGIKTIAFPCLAAGGCGFPSRVAARIALQEVREFLDIYKGYTFERIIFCVYSAIDEKAYKDFLPVFFPPTHGDLENATPFEPSRDRASLATQLQEASVQVSGVYRDLLDLSEDIPDFPQDVLHELHEISAAFDSLQALFSGPRETIQNLNGLTVTDVDLICSVMQSFSGSVFRFAEQSRASIGTPKSEMWDDYNSRVKSSKGADILGLLEIFLNFVQSLDSILSHDGIEPYEMATMRVRLGSYRLKMIGEGHKGVQDHFDEIMYTREFQRSATPSNRTDIIKLYQIPSIARLYQVGTLEYKPTHAIASANFNHKIYLLRDDITRMESDVVVNSTDPQFSSMGTLDRTLFKKGGPAMEQACSDFGPCKEGDVRVTPGFLLPAKHVIHAIPPSTYRSNSKDVLRKLYREIFYIAQSLNATSIAIPTIGTGTLNYPKRDCASLALEEVKRFLESAEPTSSIERIIFCVFGSNDEYIYKSLLPVYFPPVDLNQNKALPASINTPSSALKPKADHNPDEPNTPPKRSLFGSLGEAFRNVRFGKQPVTERSRVLNSAEQHALTNFEDHCHTCSTCNNIAKLYAEGKTLCPDGYAMAQLILQRLYMEQDRSVYSTILEGGNRGNREKVELPERYRHSWNLLVTVEMSQRDGESGRPFMNPDQPYVPDVEGEGQRENTPPGLAENNAETTAPAEEEPYMEPGTELETFTAMVFRRTPDRADWIPLSSDECIICVSSSGFEVYETEQQMRAKFPLWNLNFATARIHEKSDTELTIDPKGNGDVLLIRSGDWTKHELLFQALERYGNEHQLVRLPRTEQAATPLPVNEAVSHDISPKLAHNSGIPGQDRPHSPLHSPGSPPLTLDTTDVARSWTPTSGDSIKERRAFSAKLTGLEPLQLEAFPDELPSHDDLLPLPSSRPSSPSLQSPQQTREILHQEPQSPQQTRPVHTRNRSLSSDQVSLRLLSPPPSPGALRKDASPQSRASRHTMYSLSDFNNSEYRPLYPLERNMKSEDSSEPEKLPIIELPKRFKAQTLHHPPDRDIWIPLSSGQSIVYVYSSRVEVYETEEQTKTGIPLWNSNLTAAWVGQSTDTALVVDSKDRMGSVLFRSQSPAEHNLLLQALMRAQSKLRGTASTTPETDKSTELEQTGIEHHASALMESELEVFKAFLLRWSGVTEGWVPLHPEESFIHIHPSKATAELYATDDKTQPPLMYLDLNSLYFSKDSDLNIKIDSRGWKEPMMLRSQSSAARDILLSKMRMERREKKEEFAEATSSDMEVPMKPDYEKAMAFIFTWSDEEESWQPILPDECSIHIHPGKAEVYANDHRSGARLPLLYLDLTPATVLQMSYSDLVIDKAWREKIMLRCLGPTECEMLYRSLNKARKYENIYLQPSSVHEATKEYPEDARAFLLRWSKVDQTWFSVGAKELDVYILPTKIELYERGLEGEARTPTLSLDLTDRGVVESSEADLVLNDQEEDKKWMLRCRSPEVCSKLVEKIKRSHLERSKVPPLGSSTPQISEQRTNIEATAPSRPDLLHSFIVTWILAWSEEHLRWENLHQSGECVINFYAGHKTEIYRAGRQKDSRVPLLYLNLTPKVTVQKVSDSSTKSVAFVEKVPAPNLDLRIEKACKKDLLVRCRSEEDRKMLFEILEEWSVAGYPSMPPWSEGDASLEPAVLGQADESLESVSGPISVRPGHITTFKVPKIQKWSEERQSWENLHQQNECTIHFYPHKAEVYATNHMTQASVPLLNLSLTPSVLVVNLPGTNTNLTIEKACKKNLKVACESKEQRALLYKTLRQVMSGEYVNTGGSGTQDAPSTSPTLEYYDDSLYREKAEHTSSTGPSDQKETSSESLESVPGPISVGPQHAESSASGRTRKQSDKWNRSPSPTDQKFVDSFYTKFSQRLKDASEDANREKTEHIFSAGPSDQKETSSESQTPVPSDDPIYNPLDLPSAPTFDPSTSAPITRPVSALTRQIEAMKISNQTSPDSYSMLNLLAKRVLAYLKITSARSDVREERIANDLGAEPGNVARALEDLQIMGLAFTTVDEHTWCALYGENEPALQDQRPQEGSGPRIYVGDADEEERAIAESIEMSLPASSRVTGQPFVVEQDPKPEEDTRPRPSSYWSVSEQNDFQRNVAHFGTDWVSIANHMGTKTHTMVRNQYLRLVEGGLVDDLQKLADEADRKRERGEDLGPPPTPTPAPKRRYEGSSTTVPRTLAPTPPPEEQPQRSTTPTPAPIDLSTSNLASLNIDEFFTYLDLATSFTSAIASPTPSSSSKPRSPPPKLTRSMSLPLDEPTATNPAIPYYAVDPSHPISSIHDEDTTTQDNSPPQITHPRPTTPDRTQPAPIPPGARWTKIDRRLVNAQALEDAKERFEVREDSVVVFRVLSREEVLVLAERTRRIRMGRVGGGAEAGRDTHAWKWR